MQYFSKSFVGNFVPKSSENKNKNNWSETMQIDGESIHLTGCATARTPPLVLLKRKVSTLQTQVEPVFKRVTSQEMVAMEESFFQRLGTSFVSSIDCQDGIASIESSSPSLQDDVNEDTTEDLKHDLFMSGMAAKDQNLWIAEHRRRKSIEALDLNCCSADCCWEFSKNAIIGHRQEYQDLDYQNRQKKLMDTIETSFHLNPKSNKGWYIFKGQEICTTAFSIIFGVSRYEIDKARKLLAKDQGPQVHGNSGLSHKGAIHHKCRQWLADYFVSLCDTYTSQEFTCPIYVTKRMIHLDMLEELDLKEFEFSAPRFYSMLKLDFKNVKFPKRTKLGRCDECLLLQSNINTCRKQDEKARQKYADQMKEHTKMHTEERTLYLQRCAYSARRSEDVFHFTIDEMTHFYIPRPIPNPKGWTSQSLLQTHLVGIDNHTTKEVTFYVAPKFWGKGANATCSLIWKHLVDASQTKPLPKTLWVQFDNCWRDNKNQFVVAFFALLVAKNIFETVEISCLPPGHTHVKVDQVFSTFVKHYWSTGLGSLSNLQTRYVNSAFTKQTPKVVFVTEMYNWHHILDDQICKIKYLTQQRAFKIEKFNNVPALWYKAKMGDAVWLGNEEINIQEPLRIFQQETPTNFPPPLEPLEIDEKTLKDISSPFIAESVPAEDHNWFVGFKENPTPSYLGPAWNLSWQSLKSDHLPIPVDIEPPVAHQLIHVDQEEQFTRPPEKNRTTDPKEASIVTYKDSPSTFSWAKVLGNKDDFLKVRALYPNTDSRCEIKGPRFLIHKNSVFGEEITLSSKGWMTKASIQQTKINFRKFDGPSNLEASKV
ncbi:MAG: hypothetical protein DDT31_01056 [Syntrophomonadaceae bacterium]|nr:hypothetical protein [Bacillota bacterium]